MPATTLPRLTARGIELDTSPEKFGFLRPSTDIANDGDALRARGEDASLIGEVIKGSHEVQVI